MTTLNGGTGIPTKPVGRETDRLIGGVVTIPPYREVDGK